MAPYVTTEPINDEMKVLASDIADRAASEMNLNQLTMLYCIITDTQPTIKAFILVRNASVGIDANHS